jgi:hypothetical protein
MSARMRARKCRSSARASAGPDGSCSRQRRAGEHGITMGSMTSLELIAAHPVLGLHTRNDRYDPGAATHLAADRPSDAAHLAN